MVRNAHIIEITITQQKNIRIYLRVDETLNTMCMSVCVDYMSNKIVIGFDNKLMNQNIISIVDVVRYCTDAFENTFQG